MQGDVALGVFCHHRGGEICGEIEPVTGPQPAGALGKGAPYAPALVTMKRHLDGSSTSFADKASGNDLGVVAHQEVAWPQQIRQISNVFVCECAGSRNVEQPRRLARLARVLGDQLARQREIEIVEAEGRHRFRLRGDCLAGSIHRSDLSGVQSRLLA